MTLAPRHKPFESAGTARGLRALDLVGALHALWRAERRGAREKGFDQDRRKIHDSQHQRVQSRQRGREWIRVLRNVSCVARGGDVPHRHQIQLEEIRWRPPKCDSRVSVPPVPDGDAPPLKRATQARWMASACTTIARSVQSAQSAGCHPLWPDHDDEPPWHAHHARAERAGRAWVGHDTPLQVHISIF